MCALLPCTLLFTDLLCHDSITSLILIFVYSLRYPYCFFRGLLYFEMGSSVINVVPSPRYCLKGGHDLVGYWFQTLVRDNDIIYLPLSGEVREYGIAISLF